MEAAAIQKVQSFYASARSDAHVVARFSSLNQQRGGAPCSISGNLAPAAVGIPQLDGSRLAVVAVGYQNPAVGPGTGMAITDRPSQGGRIARLHRHLVSPGEQEIVARSMRLCKRNLHLFQMVD